MKSFCFADIYTFSETGLFLTGPNTAHVLCDYSLTGYQATKSEAMVYLEKGDRGIVEREFPSHFRPGE